MVPGGAPVLDLACGSGRHTRLFAAAGHPVTAVDIDVSGLGDLAGNRGVQRVEADLEGSDPFSVLGPLHGRTFGGVVVTNYLHRPLLEGLVAAVAPGGVLIYETFALGNERYGRPSNPAFLLRPDELLHSVEPLAVVAFEQGLIAAPKPAVIQRVCAVLGDSAPVSLDAAPPRAGGQAVALE